MTVIGFLMPAGLLALALVAIPVLLHLFRPRRVKEIPFSSLRWLKVSRQRIKRHIRWHQLILLALRAALLTLLALALSKPILSWERGQGTADRFIIVDIGRSMGLPGAGGSTPLESAGRAVETIASHVLAGDRTTILLAGRTPTLLGPLTADASAYVQRFKTIPPEPGESDIGNALRMVRAMIGDAPQNPRIELFIVTDNTVRDWSLGSIHRFLDGLTVPVRVQVVETERTAGSDSWIASVHRLPADPDGQTRLVVRVAGGPVAERRTVHLDQMPGLPDQRQTINLVPGRMHRIEFPLPADMPAGSIIARIHLSPSENTPEPDPYWLNLDSAWAIRILMLEPSVTHVPELQPGFHLRTAFESLATAGGGSPVVERHPPDSVPLSALQQADIICLLGGAPLTDTTLRQLEQRIEQGAGLVIFTGPAIDREFYNTKLHDPLRPAGSLLPVTLKDAIPARLAGGLEPITGIDWSHPLFAGQFDPLYGDLTRTRISMFHPATPVHPDQDRILAWLGHDVPLIMERQVGAGRVIFFNTSPGDAWTDLPRRRSFVPLMDQLVQHLAGGTRRGSFRMGETAVLPVTHHRSDDDTITVKSPSGKPVVFTRVETALHPWIQVPDLAETGPYRIQIVHGDQTTEQVFTVNQPSDPTPTHMDIAMLREWWAPAEVVTTRAERMADPRTWGGTRLMLDPWMMFLACLVFMAELFYTHRCCPRLNPVVTSESTVARHGFFDEPAAGRDPVESDRGDHP